MKTCKAAVWTGPSKIEVQDVQMPKVKDDGMLIRVNAGRDLRDGYWTISANSSLSCNSLPRGYRYYCGNGERRKQRNEQLFRAAEGWRQDIHVSMVDVWALSELPALWRGKLQRMR